MRRLLLALGLGVPACDQVFQLDRPPVDDTRVVIDPSLLVVTAVGPTTPVLRSERYTMPTPIVKFEDGTSPALVVEPDGTYTFDRDAPDQPYRLALTSSQGLDVELQLATSRVISVERFIGRRTAAPLPGAYYFMQSHTAEPMPATGRSFLVTTGQWTETAAPAATAYVIDWGAATSLGLPTGLFSAAAGDHAYAAYHGKRTTTGTGGEYAVVTDVCAAAEQPEMTTSLVTTMCDYAPADLSHCVHVTADRLAEDLRLRSALFDSASHAELDAAWALLAPPSLALNRAPGLRLAYQIQVSIATRFDGPVRYATPYPGHGVSLAMRVARTRPVGLPGRGVTGITAATTHFILPRADCSAPSVVRGVVGIPGDFVLGGSPLTADSNIALDRARDPILTWTRVAPGPADLYIVRLGELVGTGGGTSHVVRRVFVTTTESVRISSDMLMTGKTYLFDVEAQLGFPEASTGDLATLVTGDAPIATANNFSAVFTVVN